MNLNIFFVAIVSLLFCSSLYSQGDFSIGIRSGLTLNNYSLALKSNSYSSLNLSPYIGFIANLKVSRLFNLIGGIGYDYGSPNFETDNSLFKSKSNINYHFAEIPVMIEYLNKTGISVYGGIASNIRLESNIETTYDPPQFTTNEGRVNYNEYTKPHHFSVICGIGYLIKINEDFDLKFEIQGKKNITKMFNSVNLETNTNITYSKFMGFVTILKKL